jgi:hypothetical protein
MNQKPEFVRISTKYPAYFETTNNQTWVPVMINYVVSASKDESAAFITSSNKINKQEQLFTIK